MRLFRFWLGLCVAAAPLIAASAETPAKETVSVTAKRPAVQVLPDRTVYALDQNILSSSGTLSDALRNLPSVDVDIQGNVSLRGDSHVTILIDGKNSPLLAGNRADALQQIPADMVDSIEVITNPSAEFRAEGSGGIINIVLKKNKELAASGLIRFNVGSEGRLNGSASGNVKLGRVVLHGAFGERRDDNRYKSSTVRTDGTNPRSSQDSSGKSRTAGRYASLIASLKLSGHDTVDIGGNYNRWGGRSNMEEHNISVPNASDVRREGLARWQHEGVQAMVSYRHAFATKGEELRLDASRYATWAGFSTDYTSTDTATSVADYWQSRQSKTRETHTEFKADYVLPLPGPGRFKAGYALHDDTSLTGNHGLWRDPTMADWAEDSSFTNLFDLDRTTHAGYLSYERKLGRFGVMGGLRLEQDYLTTNLKTTGEIHNTATLGFYPSAHISYALTDTHQLRLSYSRRMNRPATNLLNPARYSNDAFNVWSGNPYLKPEQVDSFETSYRYTGEKTEAVITGYYRATYKGTTSVYRYISDTVLLTTVDNLARRMASGVEANLNTTLFDGLSLRTTGTLAYGEFNPGPQGVGKKTSGMNWNIRGGIDWQFTPDDLLQFNANYSGKQRFAQGYRDPTLSGDLGFKHSFGGGLSTVASLNNLFASQSNNSVLDSPGLHQVSHRTNLGRVFYLGLVYAFGGAKDTEPTSAETPSGYQGGAGGE